MIGTSRDSILIFHDLRSGVEELAGPHGLSVTCERKREAAVIVTMVKEMGRALTCPSAGLCLRIAVAAAFLTVLFGLQAFAVGV